MKCLIVVGPQASGKMTVGRAIAKATGYTLLHNHMTIELLLNFFPVGSGPFRRLDKLFRFSLMEEVAKSDLPGFIFTFLWAFDCSEDEEYVRHIEGIFSAQGVEVCFLELECSLQERKKRNVTPLRLEHKPSKRDKAFSEAMMVEQGKLFRFNSVAGEMADRKHLKINNEHLSPEQVAEATIAHFGLASI